MRAALAIGRTLDLSGCVYGPSHAVRGTFATDTPDDYALLAGLVRARGARTILELGTHYDGATLAMARSLLEPADNLIVTVDVTALDNPPPERTPQHPAHPP